MNINRHNYETFFLLYVDNELPATERKAVEEFVRANSDLATELQLLLDTTLPGEKINYGSPQQLYRNGIELDTLQENLLLHLDNELDAVAKNKIEAGIFSDGNIKKEWQLWEQTKLDAAEVVIFPDKKLLYRHEETPVIPIRYWKVAAAAAVLLIGLFTGIAVLKKDKPAGIPTAKNEIKNSSNKEQVAAGNEIKPLNKTAGPSEETVLENAAAARSAQDGKGKDAVRATGTKKDQGSIHNNNVAVKQPVNNDDVIEKTSLENINRPESNKTNTAAVLNNKRNDAVSPERTANEIAVIAVKDRIKAPTNPVIDYNSIPPMPDSYAKAAVSTEGAENNNKILYMNEETVSRTKVGGLFRKVKRVVERNTNIKTGKGVRIAGFEIALK